MQKRLRILAAEAVGTALLMLGGPGSAILAGREIGFLGVSLAFGFSLLVIAYAIGPVSGGHVNPAVTLGLALMRKIEKATIPFYVIGQLIGAAVGGGIIYAIAQGLDGFDAAASGFATNGWADRSPDGYNFGAMLVAEVIFTAVLVFAVLSTTSRRFTASQTGLVVGITLALIHLITIPVDNTSVNPARSFGAALWSGSSGAWEQLWAFIVFPLAGAVVGVAAWLLVDDARLEDTALANERLIDVRDRVADLTEKTAEKASEKLGQ